MGQGYGSINPLMMGGTDYWANILNNEWFQRAYMSPNINFKGNTGTGNTSSSQGTSQATGTTGVTDDGAIPVTTNTTKTPGSSGVNTALVIGGTGIAAVGALYALKKGNFGKASQVVKSRFGGGKATTNVADTLKRLTAVKNKHGEMRYMIPGKTTRMEASKASTFADDNCIKESISLARQKFNPTDSNITEFICKSTENEYAIKVENGVITSIKDKDGKEIIKELREAASGSAEAKKLESFENVLKELQKEKDADASVLDAISNIKYSNVFGDDVLEMSMAGHGKDPVLEYFTTLQRFKFTDSEMQALKLEADEKVFAEFAKNGLIKKGGRFSSDKLADGLTVSTFSKKIDGTNEYVFEGRTLVKIKRADGTELPEGSAGYIELANKYEKEINKTLKKVFEDRTEIPVGATIIPE